MVAAGALGAGVLDAWCCDLVFGRRKEERTTRDEPDIEMEPHWESAALELGCRWDSWWKGVTEGVKVSET